MFNADDINSLDNPLPTIAAAYPGADRLVHIVLRYPAGVVERIVDRAGPRVEACL